MQRGRFRRDHTASLTGTSFEYGRTAKSCSSDVTGGHHVELERLAKRYSTKPQNNIRLVLYDYYLVFVSVVSYLLVDHALLILPATWVVGSRQRAIVNLVHEAAHFKLDRRRRVNDLVGSMCAWSLGFSLKAYRREHFRHHAYLWHQQLDPDRNFYDAAGLVGPSTLGKRSFFLRHVIGAVLLVQPVVVLWRSRRIRDLALWICSAAVSVGALAGYLTGIFAIFGLFWCLPFATSRLTIQYWAEAAEHGGLGLHDPFSSSRSWRGGIVSKILIGPHHDDRFHLLHHLCPTVPCENLPSLHNEAVEVSQPYADSVHCSGFFVSSGSEISVLESMRVGVAVDADIRPT